MFRANQKMQIKPWWIGSTLALCIAAAYCNNLSSPFVFDDIPAIVENSSIRDLTEIGRILSPPKNGITVQGRPLLNFTFALNYAVSGIDVWSYHLANTLLHIASACVLYGVIYRLTIAWDLVSTRRGTSEAKPQSVAASPSLFAFGASLLWALHPLQTESVTYVVQRAESLVSLMYLLTLLCFLRSMETFEPRKTRRQFWAIASVITCFLGAACKEIIVTAPLVVLLVDRIFFFGSFRKALQGRKAYYLCLSAVSILLILYVAWHGGSRDGTAGIGTSISSWHYLLTQAQAIPHYLRLCLWPYPLVFDYGTEVIKHVRDVVWQLLLLGVMLVAGSMLAFQNRIGGFLCTCFFILLAPSSSIVPIASQTIAEHRMYLPLAPVAVAAAIGLRLAFGSYGTTITILAAIIFGTLTFQRNIDYQSAQSLYERTTENQPTNPRAFYNLGTAYETLGQTEKAVSNYRKALHISPRYTDALNNLGNALSKTGDHAGAIAVFKTALEIDPNLIRTRYNLGATLAASDDLEGATKMYESVLSIFPEMSESRINLASTLSQLGRTDEALDVLATGVKMAPGDGEVQYNYGLLLHRTGRLKDSTATLEQALRLVPDSSNAHCALADVLFDTGDRKTAKEHYKTALAINPANALASYGLANIHLAEGALELAKAEYLHAIWLAPGLTKARGNLAAVYLQIGESGKAVRICQELVALEPNNAESNYNLGYALVTDGKIPEAIAQYEHTLTLSSDERIYVNLANALARVERYSDAVCCYERLMRLRPEHFIANLEAGKLYLHLNQLDSAIVHLRTAANVAPNSIDAQYSYGLSLLAAGRFTDAEHALRRTLELKKDFPEARIYYEQAKAMIH